MAALGAMRAGAGYVTACVPASLQAILATGGPPELMTRGLPEESGGLTPAGVESRARGVPARGRARARSRARAAASTRSRSHGPSPRGAEVPLVLDADGLNAHAGSSGAHGAGHLDDLAAREAPTVLTPHAGELARLLDTDTAQIARERLAHARQAAERAQARWSCSRATTRSSPIPPAWSPSAPATAPRWRPPARAMCSPASSPRCSPRACRRSPPRRPACCCTPQAGRLAARAQGAAEGVIATDVIASLPAARTVAT